jgi:hypothetical protein
MGLAPEALVKNGSPMDRSKIIFAVYEPPEHGFPHLSVIFMPGRQEPLVATFDSKERADEFNKSIARDMAAVSA